MSTLTNTNKAAGAYRFGSSGDEYRTKGRSVRGPNWRAPAYGGHDPNDKQFASKVFGDIARKDWADYQNTFMPVHGEFKDAVMSDDLTLEQLDRIPGIVNNSFDKREQAADASANRMGLQALEHDRQREINHAVNGSRRCDHKLQRGR